MLVPPKTLKALEAAFRAIAPALRTDSPKDYARVVEMMRAIANSKSRDADLKRLSIELVRWQLTLQKKDVEAQRARFAPLAAQKVPAALAADAALAALLALFEQAIAHTKGKVQESAATPAQRAAIEKAEALAREAVARAEDALAHSTVGIPMMTLKTQPMSASGVRLAPVDSLAAMKPSAKPAAKTVSGPQKIEKQKRPASPPARTPQKKR